MKEQIVGRDNMFDPVCCGYNHELAPCKYIDTCDLIINVSTSWSDREEYAIGIGCLSEKCKRDNPNFRPMTKREFIEAYKMIPGRTMNVSLKDLWESLRMEGLVENHEYGRNNCSMTEGDFGRHMNPPEPPDGQAYISYDKNNVPWVTCCYCGKKQFPLSKGAIIKGQMFKCKGSSCKREFLVNVEGELDF